MSNNINQHDFPRPRFSGTIGLDESGADNNNDYRNDVRKHGLSYDEHNVEQELKRQKYSEASTFGYYNYNDNSKNNTNISSYRSINYPQSYHQPNMFYNQPYMYDNMNQIYPYFPNNYSQSYYPRYPTSIDPAQQQSYINYNQQINSYHNDDSAVSSSNQTNLISYEDIYSDKKGVIENSAKKVKKSKWNKGKINNNDSGSNNNQTLSDKKNKSYDMSTQYVKKSKAKGKTESRKDETHNLKDGLSQVNNNQEWYTNNDDFGENDVNDQGIINSENNKADDLGTESNKKNRQAAIPVPGTSITLITDEDIAKWREERKKMWLLKISNHKEQHREAMGIKKEDLNNMGNVLRESKKERQFIQNIQNQVNRFNPKVNLNLKFIQKEMMQDNIKLLSFIKELGDSGLLEYELTEKEKKVLYGNNQEESNKFSNHNNNVNKRFDKVRSKRIGNNNNNNNNSARSASNDNIKKK